MIKFRFLFALILMGLVFACSDTPSSSNTGSRKSSVSKKAPKKIDGSLVYNKYCVICHGKDGMQKLNGAFELPKSQMNLDERINVIANGRKLMTPFKGVLNEAEIRAVAEYTMTLKASQ